MHELVSQLADQAKNSIPRGVLDADMWIAEYNRIFAESIVRECAGFLRDTLDDHFAAEQLEEHFGVDQ